MSSFRELKLCFYLEVESLVEVRFDVLVKDICLSVAFLEVASSLIIQEVDQSIRVLAPLSCQVCLAKMNIETTSSIVDLQSKGPRLDSTVSAPPPYFVLS